MTVIDIIPDIHGRAQKLQRALKNLGWERRKLTWSHPDPNREIIFLGDFIDRGPENKAVIQVARELIDTGRAEAIMGNHELNALHFHCVDPNTGRPLRARTQKNIDQHKTFLAEFPIGADETKEVLNWMRELPLFIEKDQCRAIHAAWIQPAVDNLREFTPNGVLSDDLLIRAAYDGDIVHDLVESIAKGPEAKLDDGFYFADKGGVQRDAVRLKWWNSEAKTWRDAAVSVPDICQIPDSPLPSSLATNFYPTSDKPVFFGHYQLTGKVALQGINVACLDYSNSTSQNFVTYTLDSGEMCLHRSKLLTH